MSSTEPRSTSLYTALLAAQRAMGKVLKNAQNPHLKNRYADLTAVFNTIEQPLWDNGLIVVQRFGLDNDAPPVLITELIHVESGQSITSGVAILTKDPSDPQKVGSAITYYRRYSLMSLLGLTAEDDDGSSAGQPAPPRQQPAAEQPRPAPASNGTPLPHPLLAEIRNQDAPTKDREQALHDYFMGAHTIEELNKRQEAVKGSGISSRVVTATYNWHADRIDGTAAAPAAPPPSH